MEKASVVAINKHRINSDGYGIRTLVILEGCNLHCKYCINPQACGSGKGKMMTTEELYKEVIRDDMYFLAAGGGVTFGGGEPLIWADFIKEFSDEYGFRLHITIETSLNVQFEKLRTIADTYHSYNYIIDVKDLNRHIYEKYTGKSSLQLLRNLDWLLHNHPYSCHLRVPHIPGYNTDLDVQKTKKILNDAFDDITIEEFDYITDSPKYTAEEEFSLGRSTCAVLKDIRCEVAKACGIDYKPRVCNSKEPCSGHCPFCEQEYEKLISDIIEKAKIDIDSIHIKDVYEKRLPSYHDNNAKYYNVCHHTTGIMYQPKNLKSMLEFDRREDNRRWIHDIMFAELRNKLKAYNEHN